MVSTLADQEELITKEQLRTFHVAGRGLEFAAPKGPLRPAALDQLQQLPPFEATDLRSLYESSVAGGRRESRASFLEKLRQARARLIELLELDDRRGPEAASPGVLSSALGREGGLFFDSGALAAALRKQSASAVRRMDSDRRARIEATLATLEEALAEALKQPAVYAFEGSNSFRAALEFCDQQLARFTAVLRAMRTARLENASSYDPAVHDEALARFDWQSATPAELLALPPVVVFETAERLANASLTSFGRVLRSGRPIQVVVKCSGLYADDLTGFMPDFGYISIAHREAFVLQSSLSRPEHLSSGLAVMALTLRPAVAVVAVPETADHDARLACSLLYLSRAFPLYVYDPERGATWQERFELLVDEELPVTAADFAAMSPAFGQHFRMLPSTAWDDEQMELSEYLTRYTEDPPLAIPYLWVAGEESAPQRAVVTRELVNLCRDRQRAWKMFEELGGARKPELAAPETTPDTTDREDRARLEGATQAIYRVISMLSGPVEQAPQPVAAPVAVAIAGDAPIPEKAPETSAASEDPYIDSFLCTSCNDCFKVNPRVFQYDGNKQAFIADARSGTFAELVKAAEGCPAKCIHPGTPRPDDATVTPQLLAKAAKLR